MPICTVCESEDFDERDGLYYCQTCMTQSQDYRREEEAEEGQTYNVQSQLTKKTQKENKISPEVTKGRPWHTYEAFTIIIKEQVKALINLGASSSLKDVVLRLWCNYLSKTGVAFPEDERKIDEFMRKHLRQRERYPASLDNPQVQPIQYRKTKYKHYGVSSKKAQRHIDKQNLASALQHVEFHEGDNPLEQDEDDSELDYSSQEDQVDYSRLTDMRKQVEWMSMVKTLCLCYIGMLYTDNLVSISDLVRWAGHNRIPYYRATKLLPEDMKFDSYDYRTFQTNLLKHEHIESDTKKLLKFLKLTDIPEVPISSLTSKFIVQLDLPGELHGFVSNLIKPEINEEESDMTSLDLVAMSYIITTLQLLLGLDDSTERELSTIAVKLTSIFSNRYNMFVWSDWTTHIKQKVNTASIQDMFGDPRHCKDTKTFIENFILFDKNKKSSDSRSKRDKTVRQETQDALLRPLETLQKKLQLSKDIDRIDDVDIDLEYNPGLEPTLADSRIDMFLNSEKEESTGKELCTVSEKFRSSSFKFITQPLSFRDDLDKTNLSISAFKHSSVDGSDEDPNLSDIDLFESPPKKRKRKCMEKSAEIDKNISCEEQDNEELLILINRLSKIQEASVVIERRKQCKDLMYQSKSYQWLICMCASFLVCSTDLLHFKVMELQNYLFSDWSKSQWYRKKKLITLLKR